MMRAVILAATIAALICIWGDRPAPSRMAQVDYCVIDKRMASKEYAMRGGQPLLDEAGEPIWRWRFEWGELYAPCSQQDRFVNA